MGFRVQILDFLVFGVKFQGLGGRVQDAGFKVQGLDRGMWYTPVKFGAENAPNWRDTYSGAGMCLLVTDRRQHLLEHVPANQLTGESDR